MLGAVPACSWWVGAVGACSWWVGVVEGAAWRWVDWAPKTAAVIREVLEANNLRLSDVEGSGVIISRFRGRTHVNAHCE